MALLRIELLTGTVDGINTVFFTSADYLTGSVRVFRNGLVGLQPLTDGWSEAGGKKIVMDEPPKTGDVLQAYYRPI